MLARRPSKQRSLIPPYLQGHTPTVVFSPAEIRVVVGPKLGAGEPCRYWGAVYGCSLPTSILLF